jgi:membrane-associated protease RseP (regulator of RpoE activity)
MFKEGAMLPFTPRTLATIDSVAPNKNAEKAGFLKGDVAKSANGTDVIYWDEFVDVINDNKNKEIDIEVLRNDKIVSIVTKIDSNGTIGIINAGFDESKIKTKKYSFFESITNGYKFGIQTL